MSGKKGGTSWIIPKRKLKVSSRADLDSDVKLDIRSSAIDYAEDIKMFHEMIFNRLIGESNEGTSYPNAKTDPKKLGLSA